MYLRWFPPLGLGYAEAMYYLVRWLKDDSVVAEHLCRSIDEAKQYARDHFPVQKVRKGATSAIVVDADGVVYQQIF